MAALIPDMTNTNPLHKNQAGQPSDNGGHFAAKTFADAAEVNLNADTGSARAKLTDAIRLICDKAGYAGVMPGVYDVLLDRNEPGSQMYLALNWLTTREINEAYDEHIDDAITGAVEYMDEHATSSEHGDSSEVMTHIRAVCAEAGYAGVMPGIFEAALDRYENDDNIVSRCYAVTADDVNAIYDNHVGPAIDDLEDEVAQNHCTECGEDNTNGEGFNGLCGNCADASSCESCGGELDDPNESLCDSCRAEEDDEDDDDDDEDEE